MAYLNKILLIGNVGKNPDIRIFSNGNKIANFTLATTKKYTDNNGEQQSKTTWHNIAVSGKSADVIEKYVTKGDPIYVEGELESRNYLDNQGVERTIFEVRSNTIQLLKQKEQTSASPFPASSRDNGDLPYDPFGRQ